MRLNIVCNNAAEVVDALNYAFTPSAHGVRAYLANRPAKDIIEIDIVSDVPCCLSIESIKEALPFIAEWNIRVNV